MVLSLATCENGNSTSQAASGYLDQAGDDAVEVAVDLSGGWPVELVRGAAYLYDGEITKGKEAAAVLTTLHKEMLWRTETKRKLTVAFITPTTRTRKAISPR